MFYSDVDSYRKLEHTSEHKLEIDSLLLPISLLMLIWFISRKWRPGCIAGPVLYCLSYPRNMGAGCMLFVA
jgi:hypothetical protein